MARTRNKDFAEVETDEALEELEKKIIKIYSQASKEVQEKFKKRTEDFAEKDNIMFQRYQDGKISQDEYYKWRQGQLFIENRLNQLAHELAEDLTNANQIAMSVANGYMPEAYATNFNYQTYDVEQHIQASTSFTLYSRETVENLVKQGEVTLPKRKVDIPKDLQWNRQHLNSAILQGVLQGKSIPDIAKNLRQVTDMNRKASIRNARTMMTGAQNEGRLDAMKRASSKGIKVQKEWMATLDDRTRDSHQRLDGERKNLGELFSNGCAKPGDPNGAPEEVYNCRCTLVSYYPDYADITDKRITYQEWAKTRTSGQENGSNKEIVQEEQKYQYDHKKWVDGVFGKQYSDEEKQLIADGYANAPEEIQKLYEKYGSELREIKNINGGSYFNVLEGLRVNTKEDKVGSNLQARFGLSAHEIGHNMDFLAGGKSVGEYLSEKYRDSKGRSFKDIIYDDWDNFFLKSNQFKTVKEHTEYNDVFKVINGKSVKKSASFIDNLLDKIGEKYNLPFFTSDIRHLPDDDPRKEIGLKFVEAKRALRKLDALSAGLSDYRKLYSDNEELFKDVSPKRWVSLDASEMESFCRDMKKNYSMLETANLSDMFERYCIEHGGKEYPFYVGHGKAYAMTDGKLERETFAEMTDSTVFTHVSLDLIKQFLPNAYEAYLDMIKKEVSK